jgi:hypothetical protein
MTRSSIGQPCGTSVAPRARRCEGVFLVLMPEDLAQVSAVQWHRDSWMRSVRAMPRHKLRVRAAAAVLIVKPSVNKTAKT